MKFTKIMVLRFSAMGDVAMTVPVIKEFLAQNLNCEIIFVSKPEFKDLFHNINRLIYVEVNFNNFKGFFGLLKLFKSLKKYKPEYVVDLHNVLRTNILINLFKVFLIKTSVLDKGRKEKKQLLNSQKKIQLKSMHERYAEAFRKYKFNLELSNILEKNNYEKKGIGVAPFANYKEKSYSLDKIKNIVIKLALKGETVYLFGGKNHEKEILDEWTKIHPNIKSVAGKMSLKDEMELIKQLKLMISMDSANMHIASIVGTKVLSIWGGTHPYAGFLGYGQSVENTLVKNIDCQPCSIFGNKTCTNVSKYKCFDFSENEILSKILKII